MNIEKFEISNFEAMQFIIQLANSASLPFFSWSTSSKNMIVKKISWYAVFYKVIL